MFRDAAEPPAARKPILVGEAITQAAQQPIATNGRTKKLPPATDLSKTLDRSKFADLAPVLEASIDHAQAQRLGHQPDGTFAVEAPRKPAAVAQTAARPAWTELLLSQTNHLVDCYAEALAHASRHGIGVKPEDVRSLLVTSELDKAFRSQWHLAFEKLMWMVLNGDMEAHRIYWDRVFPKPTKLSVRMEGMPQVTSPGDARAAMATVFQRVADGELTIDDGSELVMMYSRYVAVHNVQTVNFSPVETNHSQQSAREVLEDRLRRLLPAPAAETPAPAPAGEDDVEITPEEIAQLKDTVTAQVEEALRKRGYGE